MDKVQCMEPLNCGADVCERVQSGFLVTTFSLSPEDRDSVIRLLSWRVVPGDLRHKDWRKVGFKSSLVIELDICMMLEHPPRKD